MSPPIANNELIWPPVVDTWVGHAERCAEDMSDDALMAEITQQGLLPVVAEAVVTGQCPAWAQTLKTKLKLHSHSYLAWHLAAQAELRRVLEAAAANKVELLLLKGAALGPSIYPQAHYRMISDIDVMVAPQQRQASEQLLLDLGYRPSLSLDGDLVFQARAYRKTVGAATLSIDLHWRLSNRPLLSDILTWPDLRREARHHRGLLIPHPRHALLHACMHRAGHHRREPEKLHWLTDIHLLWCNFSPEQQRQAVQFAIRHGIAALLLDAMQTTQKHFATAVDATLIEDMEQAQQNETSAQLLHANSSTLWSNLRHLPSLRLRLRYLRQLAFPGRDYMAQRYGTHSNLSLPWLYLKRGLKGLAALTKSRQP